MNWTESNLGYTQEQHDRYEQDGFAFLGKCLSDEGLASAKENLMRVQSNRHSSLGSAELYSVHQQELWLLELLSSESVLDVVEKVIGPNIVLWSSQLICKEPHSDQGVKIPWHQDLPYWNIGGRTTSLWIALDDVDEENGTMYVLPKWHRHGTLERRATTDHMFPEEISPSALPPDVDQLAAGYFLKAGEAGMHDTMIPHRSSPNGSDRWRRIIVVRYMNADGEMGQKQYPNYHTGEMFDRKYILVRGRDVLNRGLDCLQTK